MATSIVRYENETAGILHIQGDNPNDWKWESAGTHASQVIENKPGEMPNLIRFLAPEGELARILNGKSKPEYYIQTGLRFLSNIAIAATEECFGRIIPDRHTIRLADTTKDHEFKGYYNGPRDSMTDHFNDRVGGEYKNPTTPRFSGAQLKLPMTICEKHGENVLSVASGKPFTHILKFGGDPKPGDILPRSTIPVAEWMGLELSKRCGLETSEKALIRMPQENTLALLVERFDIPSKENADKVSYLISDFCNICDVYPHTKNTDLDPGKYCTPLENTIDAFLSASSAPEEDARALYKRVVLGFFMRDLDMHMKNLSVLKTVNKETGEITTRFSPTYDAVPTLIYPEEKTKSFGRPGEVIYKNERDEHFSLPVNGKTKIKEFEVEDFIAFGGKLNIPEAEAEQIFNEIGQTCALEAAKIAKNPPSILKNDVYALFALARAATEIVMNAEDVLPVEVLENEDLSIEREWDWDDRVWEKGLGDFIEDHNSSYQSKVALIA